MKKLLSLILALTMLMSLAACGGSTNDETQDDLPVNGEIEAVADDANDANDANDAEGAEDDAADAGETEEKDAADEQQPAAEQKPAEEKKDNEQKPAASKPASKPVEQPSAEQPAADGVETPSSNSSESGKNPLSATLMAAFKGMDASASALDMANALSANSAIEFAPGTVEVQPGLLSGFGNYEVSGFSSGAMFAPVIGSIAFVGYVFELADGADAAAFMNELKANANPRWNVCVEAEKPVVASNGNKVFFVMVPMMEEDL